MRPNVHFQCAQRDVGFFTVLACELFSRMLVFSQRGHSVETSFTFLATEFLVRTAFLVGNFPVTLR